MPFVINWDNGNDACGTFTHLGTFDTEEEAQEVADATEAEQIAEGVWDEDGFCEVVWIDDEEDVDPRPFGYQHDPYSDPRDNLPHDSLGNPLQDEESLAYFDRYIAGDR